MIKGWIVKKQKQDSKKAKAEQYKYKTIWQKQIVMGISKTRRWSLSEGDVVDGFSIRVLQMLQSQNDVFLYW